MLIFVTYCCGLGGSPKAHEEGKKILIKMKPIHFYPSLKIKVKSIDESLSFLFFLSWTTAILIIVILLIPFYVTNESFLSWRNYCRWILYIVFIHFTLHYWIWPSNFYCRILLLLCLFFSWKKTLSMWFTILYKSYMTKSKKNQLKSSMFVARLNLKIERQNVPLFVPCLFNYKLIYLHH